MARPFTSAELETYLDSKPGWINLSTIDKQGYPHTVPLGFFRYGADIVMGVRDNTQKLVNIRDNPKVSLMIESGTGKADIQGVMIQGNALVYSDSTTVLKYMRAAATKRGVAEADLPDKARSGAAYIVVSPKKYISWTADV